MTASAPAATFYQKAVVDLAATSATPGGTSDIGSNPIAVAWDGTNAYVAGFNAGATARDTAIVPVTNVLTSPTIGTRFGVQASTPTGRGYANADFRSGVGIGTNFYNGTTPIVSVYTTAGVNSATNTPGGANPSGGVGFDTLSNRLTYIYQNSGLARNIDVTTGTVTGTPNTNIGPTYGTAFRDFDYDVSGNLYARVNNNVIRANRVDAGTYSATPTQLVDLTDVNNVGENVQVVEGFASSPTFAIYNDRTLTAGTQNLTDVVKAIRADGTSEALSFLTSDGSALATFAQSAALYDFSYDATTKTLAVLDYGNRQLFIFGATASVPEPTTLAAVAGAGLAMLRRRRRRRA